ncbi:sodium-dependent multivitamin transporter-like isoform X2 [Cloeon dipterum]
MYSNIIAFPLVAYIFVPTFYRLKLTSAYEYLELRFDNYLIRLLASLTFAMQSMLYLGVVVFAPSIALHTVSGFPYWVSMVSIGLIGTFYTAIGGLRAVVWTDVLQGVLMLGGLVAIIAIGAFRIGGLGEAFRISGEHGRLDFLNFDPNPFLRHTTLICVIGGLFNTTATFGCHQTSVQRYCSTSTLKSAVWTMLLNIPLLTLMVSLGWIAGAVVFANYAECDPVLTGHIKNKDAIVPYFVLRYFSGTPGLVGLFVASLVSASLSSVSSLLNSMAAVVWQDFFSQLSYFSKKDEHAQLNITKALGFIFGFMMIGLGFLVSNMSGLIQTTFTLVGAIQGPLLGVFLIALFVPWANKYGAVVGMLCGHALSIWITYGALNLTAKPPYLPLSDQNCANEPWFESAYGTNKTISGHFPGARYTYTPSSPVQPDIEWPDKLYTISYMYYGALSCCVTMVIGFVISTLTACLVNTKPDVKLLHPLVWRFVVSEEEKKEKSNYGIKPKLDGPRDEKCSCSSYTLSSEL